MSVEKRVQGTVLGVEDFDAPSSTCTVMPMGRRASCSAKRS
jgi:hypothetical protein